MMTDCHVAAQRIATLTSRWVSEIKLIVSNTVPVVCLGRRHVLRAILQARNEQLWLAGKGASR